MLQFNQTQMDIFRKTSFNRFVQKTTEQLRKNHPKKFDNISSEALENFVLQGIKSAKYYHITNQEDVSFFVNSSAKYGEGFVENPRYYWIKEILESPDVAIEDKVEEIQLQENILKMHHEKTEEYNSTR